MPNHHLLHPRNGSQASGEERTRDPEDRPAASTEEIKEKMQDKTAADSFPASDPPSTIPDPEEEDSFAA